MKISEFKDSYVDTSRLPETLLLNMAVDTVIKQGNLSADTELTPTFLHAVYTAIAAGTVEPESTDILLSALQGSVDPKEAALRIIDRTREQIFQFQ